MCGLLTFAEVTFDVVRGGCLILFVVGGKRGYVQFSLGCVVVFDPLLCGRFTWGAQWWRNVHFPTLMSLGPINMIGVIHLQVKHFTLPHP